MVAIVLRFVLQSQMQPVLGIAILGAGVLAAVSVFMLAIKLYGKGVGIPLGTLALIPLIGLIVLLIVNGRATGVLKKNGIKVGLLGVNLSRV